MKKRFLSLILVLCMILTMMPSMASSDPPDELDLADGSIKIENGDITGNVKLTYGEDSWEVPSTDPIIITQTNPSTPTSNIIEISADVPGGVNIKLNGVNILGTNASLRIYADAGKVNLILADDSVNTLTATGSNAGLRKNNTAKSEAGLLTISCEDAGDDHTCNSNCGKLIAVGGSESAGIGSGRAEGTASNITISGGIITATGDSGGAGIGGGDGGAGSNITISGGIITATGDSGGAGIGGGDGGAGSNITISGGIITATGGSGGAGIGGGNGGAGSNITISGGIITATGGKGYDNIGGAGIGGGYKKDGSNITISGGIVSATGENGGAGIGGGTGYFSLIDFPGGSGKDITISGGTVTASANSTNNSRGHGIGAGGLNGENGVSTNITITGGNVYASSIGITPKNDSGTEVYKATFSIPGDTTGGTTPDAISFNRNNTTYSYGMNDARSILDEGKGKLFVYLPVGTYSTVYGGKTYTAEVDNSGQAEFVALPPAITAFNFNELTPNVTGTVDEVNKTIALTVPYGTNVTELVPTITHTGTSVSPNTGVAQNFTNPVEYTVTAADSSTQMYNVTVTVTDPVDITAASVIITAPILGAAPQDAAAVQAATNHADYTITDLEWNEALTAGDKFKASQVYTATVTLTSKNGKKFQAAAFTPTVAGSSSVGTTTTSGGDVAGNTVSFTVTFAATASGGGGGGSGNSTPVPPPPAPVITISEVKSELFDNAEDIKVEADVTSAFGQSVEVKITDSTESQNEIFSLAGVDDKVYPFDISLYSKESSQKVQPKDGYSVKITIPVPEKLLEDKEQIKVVYGKDGKLETLKSELIEKDGKWYIVFEAVHFSPYALVVSAEPSVSWTNPFSDVQEGSWYYSAIQYVAQNGLMLGTGNNTFSPGITTNRGMIATILYRLNGSDETFQSTFKDVNPDAYYAKGVAWAQEKGIIAGYGNGMFGPEDSITREQMAAILWRYAGSPATVDSKRLSGFKDVGEISLYAKDALAWIYEKGIIAGKGNGILDSKGKATRAEVAQIMYNFEQKTDLTE